LRFSTGHVSVVAKRKEHFFKGLTFDFKLFEFELLLFICLGFLDKVSFGDLLTSLDLILLNVTLSSFFRGQSRLNNYKLRILSELSSVNRQFR
jgi:hypothetical protein